jgi:phosphoglycolate phosphatase
VKRIDTIIFDMDGTLLNSLGDIADGVNYILKKYGYPPRTYDEIKSFVGNGAARLMSKALPDGQQTPDFERILEEYKKYYLDHNNIKTSPYAGSWTSLLEHETSNPKQTNKSNNFLIFIKDLL